ncbi:glycogen synthase [Agrococcus carbonis]|uniref:Glycogen synthase (ADP-glucose) n=1 Tax=Agrococcus carbonis TaxID=684552 RepID=A0A1H1KWF7_9MICO|nr:glycogen synthase [Agrococcus carbonis]SDR66115.1 glycogen synthase (ADP-glucose) [Agrococcus carbonis]
MRVDLLTKEYPPAVYGGAGVHVTELVRALRRSIEVQVRCFGAPRDEADVTAYDVPAELAEANAALQTLAVDLQIADAVAGTDLVHSHTWYANEAGRLAQQLHGVPHVVSAHSLEPLRPWKAEQLGGGYRISSDVERRAYEAADRVIAVSDGMRADILRSYPALDPERVVTVYNGIDLEAWAPNPDADRARALGLDPDHPSVVFVGRITRQKGLPHLLRAARELPEGVQLILCAGAPDTAEIMGEVRGLVEELQSTREGVVWIDDVLPRDDLRALLTHATTFVCPSVYEPLGIVNLEAMACGAPVVGSATGGIPEVVDDGVTGFLVPIDQVQDGTGTPTDPARYEADLADALTRMLADPEAARRMGAAGRERARERFDWGRIAEQTRGIYEAVLAERSA